MHKYSGNAVVPNQAASRGSSGTEWFAGTILTFLVVVIFFTAVVSFSIILANAVSGPVDVALIAEQFVEQWRRYLNPEPIERLTYLISVFLTFPIVIGVSLALKNIANVNELLGLVGSALAAAFLLLTFFDQKFTELIFGRSELSSVYIINLFISVLFSCGIFLYYSKSYSHKFLLMRKKYARISFASLLAYIIFFIAPLRVRSPDTLYGDMHFEAVYYSITQIMAGKTAFADLPSQYGLYGEILAPFLYLTGYNVTSLTVIFSILQCVAYFAIVSSIFLTVQNNIIRLICCFSVLFFVGSNWIFVSGLLTGYEYYQIWPIRMLFPAIIALGFVQVWHRGLRLYDFAVLCAVAGLAVVWNLDWGIPVWGGLIAVMVIRILPSNDNIWPKNIALLVISISIPIAVFAIFAAYLTAKSGYTIDWANTAKYQRIFFLTGFGMLPMPLYPHPWMAAIAIYILGLVYAVRVSVTRKPTLHSDFIIYLCVFGIGIFTYYQGRSHDIVLSFVIWPAIFVAFILADQTLTAVRSGKLHRFILIATFPILFFGLAVTNTMLFGTSMLLQKSVGIFQHLPQKKNSKWRIDVEFIQQHVGMEKEAVIIASGQALLFGETKLASAIRGPGYVEMLLKQDQVQLIERLIASPHKHVFIQEDKSGNFPDVYKPVLTKYLLLDKSDAGLYHLIPIKVLLYYKR